MDEKAIETLIRRSKLVKSNLPRELKAYPSSP
jgi:hypothetical protein